MAPHSVTVSMLRRWIACKGVSRTNSTSLRLSFSTTSAARVSKLVVTPLAISARVRTEQGKTTMPMVRNDPLAIAAPISRLP